MHVGLAIHGDLDQCSGGYRYDRELVSRLEARGDTVDVISLPRPDADTDTPVRDRLDRSVDVLLQDELCRPTLVEHNEALTQPASIVTIVHDLRSPDPGVDRQMRVREQERRYLETVDAAICTSQFTRDRLVADLFGRSADAPPTLVAPPAGRAEGTAVAPAVVADRTGIDPLRLLFVGNLIPRKGVLTLLDALAQVDRPWELTIVGSHEADPAYANRVRDRVGSHPHADRITLTGQVDDATLAAHYRHSQVLVMPSRYEAFGMVALEAMEYGVVPIATRVGGPGEFVDDEENGLLIDPDAPAEIATSIRDLADDRDRLARFGEAALETAAAHPTWTETTTEIRSFLAEVTNASSGSMANPKGGDQL